MNITKKKLLIKVISFVLAALLATVCTFAYFPDDESLLSAISSTSSSDEEYQVLLYWSNSPNGEWNNAKASGTDIVFPNTVLWEPGHSEVRYFRISNPSDADYTYELDIDGPGDDYDSTDSIGDVIDVYSTEGIGDDSDISSAPFTYVGTLNEVILNPQVVTGTLAKNSDVFCALQFTMKTSAGNEYQCQKVGFKIKANAYGEGTETEPEFDGTFGIALPNYEDYLYRVGNTNTVPATSLFYINEEESSSASSLLMMSAFADSSLNNSLVSFTFTVIAGTASGTVTLDDSDWENDKFSFSNTGVINVKLLYNNVEKVSLNLEVVEGKNIFSAASATGSNIILLNDISSASNLTVSNGHTLYGNGFSITDKRTTTSGTAGFLNISNGYLDNVQVIGQEYPELTTSGVSNNYYSPCVRVNSGGAVINNSYVCGCRFAVWAEGNLSAENSTFAGGTYAIINITSGNIVLTNCTTAYIDTELKGLAVLVGSSRAHVTLNGTFTQYNWAQSSDVPSDYSKLLSDVFSDEDYAYTSGGKTYINTGIMCASENEDFEEADVKDIITDNTSNTYGYKTKPAVGITATCYLPKSSMASQDALSYPGYTVYDQYPTLPDVSFDYTTLNYIEKTAESSEYCYYDSASDSVLISFESTQGSFSWNPMIMTASKYGDISYSVTMNGTDYTDSTISFTSAGDYEVIYTFTDYDYYSGADAHVGSIEYTETVKVSVTITDPSVVIYHPLFTFTDGSSTKSTIISNNTYVMPDVSATSSTIGSTTVDGVTVYYPIVTVNGAGSGGGTYSRGGLYYFAPAFTAVNITDYNQDTGASQYTYSSSSSTWPHDQSSSDGPDTTIYNFDSSNSKPDPYEPSCGDSAKGHAYISGKGLCFSTSNLSRNGTAGNRVVKFYYVGNDNVTYYYYICYAYTATTYQSACFAEGTKITLADGSKKAIEDLTFSDNILSWNFFEGGYEAQNVAMIVNHGKSEYNVVTTKYSDGSKLRIIGSHGIYDYDLNDFVYIDAENCEDYIGHRFVKYKSDGSYKLVKLKKAYVRTEYVTAYSIASCENLDAFASGLLTMTPPPDYYNWIKKGDKLKYDLDWLNDGVEKYGLYEYKDFEDFLSYEQFKAFNLPYCKVAVGKDIMTYDYILSLIDIYSVYFV